MVRLLFSGTLILLLSFACKERATITEVSKTKVDSLATASALQGKKLMEQKCYLCHSPTAQEKKGRIGPPMIAVKAHYQQDVSSKDEFVAAITDFVFQPERDKVKLKGAARRFGLMPKAEYDSVEIEKIALYLYTYQIEEPDWFEEHWLSKGFEPYTNKSQTRISSDNNNITYAEIGMSYALGTKKVLGSNLMGTIQKEGVPAALAFCNEKAYPLTDSMALVYNARIKRVSDKPRNPENMANEKELEYIQTFKQAVNDEQEIQPIVQNFGNEVQFYAPILTNQMCLKCHGNTKSDVSLEVQNLLTEKYPNDQATGYGINEVRGIWSITFEKQDNVKF